MRVMEETIPHHGEKAGGLRVHLRVKCWSWSTLALLAGLLGGAGACTNTVPLKVWEREVTLHLLSPTPPRQVEPVEALRALGVEDYALRLRRIVVKYSSWLGFKASAPVPLLSQAQVQAFAPALKAHLPGLKANQRLLLRFKDAREGLGVLCEIYAEGADLVFRFQALVRDLDPPPSMGRPYYRGGQRFYRSSGGSAAGARGWRRGAA